MNVSQAAIEQGVPSAPYQQLSRVLGFAIVLFCP